MRNTNTNTNTNTKTIKITIKPGQTLWDALEKKENVTAPERPCGGYGHCGRCGVWVNGRGVVTSCQFREPGTYEVRTIQERSFDAVSLTEEEWRGRGGFSLPSIAVDIGTTTVAIVAVYRTLRVERSFVNPQRKYGADVMSRIAACNRGEGKRLRELLKERLAEELALVAAELEELSASHGRDLEVEKAERLECWEAVIGGNTTMLHIFMGYSCEGLGRSPFSPVSLAPDRLDWEIGGRHMRVTLLPGISAYLGADLVSGIYSLRITERRKLTCLIDLGTNGEMALGNCGRLLCASAAAGPAFEGSEPAMRLHAAGLLRLLHELSVQGIMDETGLLSEPFFTEGYPISEGNSNTKGDSDQEKHVSADIRMYQEDIRELQMAKGAIRAGIEILLREYGAAPEDVEEICLAGGMGYYLDPEDALAIGLLPESFAGKLRAVGNTCLSGALRFLKDQEEGGDPLDRLGKITEIAEEVLLADHRDFEELYIENMNF